MLAYAQKTGMQFRKVVRLVSVLLFAPLVIWASQLIIGRNVSLPSVKAAQGSGTVSIKFVGSGTAMGATEVAGVIAKSHWNQAVGINASMAALVDETGVSSGATITWKADNPYSTPITDQAGNYRMMRGYLDNHSGNPSVVTVSGLPANTSGYKVYVYADGNNDYASRAGTYQISGTGITTTNIQLTDAANTNFKGAFSQATNSAGNFMIFTINATAFKLTVTSGSASDGFPRAALNGIQIVPQGAAAADFTLSATPVGQQQAVAAAGSNVSANFSINVDGVNGFTGNVALTATGLPTGASATFQPASVPVGSSSTLTVTTTSTTPAGSYNLTITGTSGSLSHSATVPLSVSAPASSAGGVIGVKFVGSGTAMASSEIAGVVAKSNWNQAKGNNSTMSLLDEDGSTTGATVNWKSDNTWFLPITDGAGNARMMRGYLDNHSGNPTTVTVTGLPSVSGGYKIYVYADGDNPTGTRSSSYRISGTGVTATTVNLTDAANTNFNGTFKQATGSNGNYIVFSINSTGFTLTATSGTTTDSTMRAPVNAIQFVPQGTGTGGGGTPDTTAPTVTVTAPSGGATISGTTTLTATASDNVGVASVQFRVDGTNVGAADASSPYSVSLNTATLTNGTHTISAAAADAAGNHGTSASVSVTVSNSTPDTTAPSVSVTAPSNGATVSGTTILTATASDNVGVASVQFQVDGASVGGADTASPYSTSLNTTTLTNGTHTITAVAADAAGNHATSSGVSVTVNNTTGGSGFSGPLRVSTVNPRYFTDNTGKAIFLAGSHTWPNLEDLGFPAPATFDYTSYMSFMKSHNYNMMHMWTEFFSNDGPTYGPVQYVAGPFPWSRPGPGVANDGQPKYDFTQLNQAYFDRLRARTIQAGQNGIYVSIYLFNGYENQFSINSTDGNPFENSNNINGVNCPDTCPNDNSRIPAQAWTYQKNYIHKVIDTVNDLDNVLYMTSDESGAPYSTSWQASVIAEVKSYQATKAKQHPVGMGFQYKNGTDQTLYNSAADWVSPAYGQGGLNVPSSATGQCPTVTGNGGAANTSSPNCKVVVNDTDHDCGICGSQDWAWQNFTRGNSILFMDAYLADGLGNNPSGTCFNAQCSVLDPQWTPVRNAMTDTLSYAKRMDLIHMTPQNGLSSTTFCLANAGVEYLVYQSGSGAFTVNLAAATYSYEWFNPSNHTVVATGFVTVTAGNKSFTPPFSGDAVLYLKAQ